MTSELFNRFVPVICTGFGLVLVGSVNLLLVNRRMRVRVLATLGALSILAIAVASLDQPRLVTSTAQLLAGVLAPVLLPAFRPVPNRLAVWVATLNSPRVRFGLLVFIGAAVTGVAIVLFECADNAAADANTAELEHVHGPFPSAPNRGGHAVTDR